MTDEQIKALKHPQHYCDQPAAYDAWNKAIDAVLALATPPAVGDARLRELVDRWRKMAIEPLLPSDTPQLAVQVCANELEALLASPAPAPPTCATCEHAIELHGPYRGCCEGPAGSACQCREFKPAPAPAPPAQDKARCGKRWPASKPAAQPITLVCIGTAGHEGGCGPFVEQPAPAQASPTREQVASISQRFMRNAWGHLVWSADGQYLKRADVLALYPPAAADQEKP